MVASASATPTYPSGIYGKYKRATGCFLGWLLRASQLGGFGVLEKTNNKQKKKKSTHTTIHSLDGYERVVQAIVLEPLLLPESVRRQWSRAMAACECAITLRAIVAEFYASTDPNDSHLHFLQRLMSWFQLLGEAKASVGEETPTMPKSMGEKTLDFANYYDVLDLPDEFFEDEVDTAAPESPTLPSSHARRTSVHSLDDDHNTLELAYFLLELDELSEAVYNAFADVKRQQKTLIESHCRSPCSNQFCKTNYWSIPTPTTQHP